jgi:hypothetical protein
MPGDAWAKFKKNWPGLAKVKEEQTAARKAGKRIPHPELSMAPKKAAKKTKR